MKCKNFKIASPNSYLSRINVFRNKTTKAEMQHKVEKYFAWKERPFKRMKINIQHLSLIYSLLLGRLAQAGLPVQNLQGRLLQSGALRTLAC
jgi:hypothetical protein